MPNIVFEFLVLCFNPVLSDRHFGGGGKLKKQNEDERKLRATPVANHASKVFFAVNL